MNNHEHKTKQNLFCLSAVLNRISSKVFSKNIQLGKIEKCQDKNQKSILMVFVLAFNLVKILNPK